MQSKKKSSEWHWHHLYATLYITPSLLLGCAPAISSTDLWPRVLAVSSTGPHKNYRAYLHTQEYIRYTLEVLRGNTDICDGPLDIMKLAVSPLSEKEWRGEFVASLLTALSCAAHTIFLKRHYRWGFREKRTTKKSVCAFRSCVLASWKWIGQIGSCNVYWVSLYTLSDLLLLGHVTTLFHRHLLWRKRGKVRVQSIFPSWKNIATSGF